MSHGPRSTVIPMPDFVPGSRSRFDGVARFHCPLGCGWWHDEPTDPGPQSLILPEGFTSADLSSMLSLNAEARVLTLHARVEQAISDHYSGRHPGA